MKPKATPQRGGKDGYLSHIHLKRFVDDGESWIILNVLPSAIPVDNNARKKPVVVSVGGIFEESEISELGIESVSVEG